MSPTPIAETSPDKADCKSLDQMPAGIRRLIEEIQQHDHLTPSRAKQLLSESGVTSDDLAPWADFDHPPEDSYGRRLIFDGGFFELMAMSWVDGDMAAIHDHGYTQWGAVKLLGPAEHAIFRLDGDRLSTAERKEFPANSVVAVGHDMVHQMGNVGQSPFLSLHLYGCYEREGDVTADARLYALDEGQVQITCGGVFFGLPEDCVESRLDGPTPDFPTLLRDRVELLARLLRSRDDFDQPSLETPREHELADWLFGSETWSRGFEELAELAETSLETGNERALDIAFQELRAAGRLQLRLVDSGAAPADWQARRDGLADALAETDLGVLGSAYLDVVASALELEPVAALELETV